MTTTQRKSSWLFLIACLVWLCGVAGSHAAPLEISVATAYSADNFQTQNLQQFAQDVKRATSGAIVFKIFPAGTLLKPVDIFSGVRAGRAGAGEVMMSSLAREHLIFGLDSLPFIVSDYDDAKRMWDASRQAVEKALAEKDLQLLYAVPWPAQNLYASREIKTIRDFKGLSMRSYNQATERIAELIGANPVTIQVMDLRKAIEAGKLDLMLTSSWTGVDTQVWSRLKYYYKVNAWIPKNVVFIDKKLFENFDADTRSKLLDAARIAEKRGWKLSQESDRRYENELAANNVNISTMDFFLRSYLDRMGENLAREWLQKAGADELKVLLKYTTERSMK
jgi:TRAP-type C4-dicarboxylate transport system substrate-binding protein